MLFVFPDESIRSFWMFKTAIPLDIVYVDAQLRVINSYSAKPLDPRLLYPSLRPAQYVIEMRAGVVKRWGIEPGDAVKLPEAIGCARQ
jgi:uncharacterized membrane protein (UPF0127 family)